jgi:hypothetical protein
MKPYIRTSARVTVKHLKKFLQKQLKWEENLLKDVCGEFDFSITFCRLKSPTEENHLEMNYQSNLSLKPEALILLSETHVSNIKGDKMRILIPM